jgi:hypothetical protein
MIGGESPSNQQFRQNPFQGGPKTFISEPDAKILFQKSVRCVLPEYARFHRQESSPRSVRPPMFEPKSLGTVAAPLPANALKAPVKASTKGQEGAAHGTKFAPAALNSRHCGVR